MTNPGPQPMGAPSGMGSGMGSGMPGGQQRTPTQQEEFQFYSALFKVLDTENKQALSGGQVFNFYKIV